MNLESQLEKISQFKNLELLANQIVEGFISGMHKSPFHGFSAEFAEHKVYNQGESTKYIDFCQNRSIVYQKIRGGDQSALPFDY